MSTLQTLLETSLIIGIFFIVLQLVAIWLFLRSAISSGVSRGILKANEEIERLKKNPPPNEHELLEQELKGWE